MVDNDNSDDDKFLQIPEKKKIYKFLNNHTI